MFLWLQPVAMLGTVTPPVDPQAQQPLYQQLADELRSAIRRGGLVPGDRIPSERELIDTHGVSRTTVRLALGVLKSEGLVVAGHGRGNFVHARPPVRLSFTRFSRASRQPDMGPWGVATRRAGVAGHLQLVTVEQQPADAELAVRLELDEGAPVILRSRRMYADNHLVQLYDGYYPLDLVEGTELASSAIIDGGTYAAFERIGRHPERATEEVGARAPTPEETRLLHLGAGAPVLTTTRTTRDSAGRVLEVLQVVASADANVFVYEDLPLD